MALGVLGVAAVVLVIVIVVVGQKNAEHEAEKKQIAASVPPVTPRPQQTPVTPSFPTAPLQTPDAAGTPTGFVRPPDGPSEMERLQRMQIPNVPATMDSSDASSMPAGSMTGPKTPDAAAKEPELKIRGVEAAAPLMAAALPEDAARAKSVPTMLSAARTAMRNRDYAKAEEVILSAQITADSPALIDLALGHARALELLRTFWDAARLGLKSVKPGDELMFNGKAASVVSADETNLVVKLENKDVPLVVDKLIPLVAAQLAEKALPKDEAGGKLVVAVFLILDQPAGHERGKQLFDEATVAGLDVNSLRPLLDAK
ncbi:MAG: hypothetical protein QM775_26410 [Pirellulales bacterium]